MPCRPERLLGNPDKQLDCRKCFPKLRSYTLAATPIADSGDITFHTSNIQQQATESSLSWLSSCVHTSPESSQSRSISSSAAAASLSACRHAKQR